MFHASLIVLVAALVACDSKPSSSPAKQAPATPAPAPPPPVTEPLPKISCAKAVPDAIKAKYFPDAKLASNAEQPTTLMKDNLVTMCLYKGAKRDTDVQVRCGPLFTDINESMNGNASTTGLKYERVSGIARGAFKKVNGERPEFAVLHQTLPCLIDVEIGAVNPADRIDPQPIAVDIANALTR